MNISYLVLQEASFFFGTNSRSGTACFDKSTMCVIKPHAVAENLAGKILTSIINSEFKITALQMFHLEKANTEEFLEIYKGVVNEYSVSEMCKNMFKNF